MLADMLKVGFVDGDDLHPPFNLAKMSAGFALNDADRAPWLDAVAQRLDNWRHSNQGGVIACSALKRAYRDKLSKGDVQFIYLSGEAGEIKARLEARRDHFMPASLLDSQLAALEPPEPDENALIIPPAPTVEIRCSNILSALIANS